MQIQIDNTIHILVRRYLYFGVPNYHEGVACAGIFDFNPVCELTMDCTILNLVELEKFIKVMAICAFLLL